MSEIEPDPCAHFSKVEMVERGLYLYQRSGNNAESTALTSYCRRYIDKTLAIFNGKHEVAIEALELTNTDCPFVKPESCEECKSAARLFCNR